MADFAKVLDSISKFGPVSIISGIGGYFTRVFSSERRKRRMREQLYREISNNNQKTVVQVNLVTSITGLKAGAPFRFNEKLDLSFAVWNFYNDEKRRELLFELEEAEAINRIYDKFLAILNENLSGYAHVRGKVAAAEVDDCLLDGTLDRDLYRKVSSPQAWGYMHQLLTGGRESNRAYLNPL